MASDDVVYADDLINVLKRKHEANSYASMVVILPYNLSTYDYTSLYKYNNVVNICM